MPRVLVTGPDDHQPEPSERQTEEARPAMGTASAERMGRQAIDDDAETLDRLARFEHSLIDGSIEKLGSVGEQLSQYIEHRGL